MTTRLLNSLMFSAAIVCSAGSVGIHALANTGIAATNSVLPADGKQA
jgi:hypothetical protein